MKIARLLLAVVSLSLAASACAADITAPSPSHRSNDAAPAVIDTTSDSWQGASGSGA